MFGFFHPGFSVALLVPERNEVEQRPFAIEYVLANTEFTLLHEFGHALIAELDIPVLGREEDAADQLATLFLLLAPERSRDSLLRQLDMVGIELRFDAAEDTAGYGSVHPPTIERYYNLLCLAHGRHQDFLHETSVTKTLPVERGWFCDIEYLQAEKSMRWIARTYGVPGGRLNPAVGSDEEQERPLVGPNVEGDFPEQAASGAVVVRYAQPSSLNGELLVENLRSSGLADKLALQIAKNFRLPRNLDVSFANCGEDAYWNERSGQITVCYYLLENYYRHAKQVEMGQEGLAAEMVPLNLLLPRSLFRRLQERASSENTNLMQLTEEALQHYLTSDHEEAGPGSR